MQTTMDSGGRIVLPKAVRERLNLEPGQRFEIHVEDSLQIVIEAVQAPVRLETGAGGLPVLVADGDVPKIGDEDVRGWRDELAEERERRWA